MFTAAAIWPADNSYFSLTQKLSLRISKIGIFIWLCAYTNSVDERRRSNFATAADDKASKEIRNASIRIILLHKFVFEIYTFTPSIRFTKKLQAIELNNLFLKIKFQDHSNL